MSKNIVVAVDSFKGSLASMEAGQAIAKGIKLADSENTVTVFPLADGGEGTVAAITRAKTHKVVKPVVKSPLGDDVECSYCILDDGTTAVMEMSAASGLTLVPRSLRNPMNTSTFGVGQMIRDAMDKGCRRFIIGVGGSATNDGGTGMLTALGFKFLNEKGERIQPGAKGLESLTKIETENADKRLMECEFTVACDVTNSLCGENGCSMIFGPQKGASFEDAKVMDGWMQNFARLTKEVILHSDENAPGTGAAGGLGFAFMAYLGGRLTPGIDIVIAETGIEEVIRNADIVVTGEGRLDMQSFMGKAPVGIAKIAKKYGKVVIAISGSVDGSGAENDLIDACFAAVHEPCTLAQAMDKDYAMQNLTLVAEQVFKLAERLTISV